MTSSDLARRRSQFERLGMQHPEVLPFIALLAALFGGVVLAVNVWSYKRRAKLTAEERAAEDKATDEDGFFW